MGDVLILLIYGGGFMGALAILCSIDEVIRKFEDDEQY